MDTVRFGRALGFGARSAARALAGAVDAASAPNPNQPAPPSRPPASSPSRPAASSPVASGPVASGPVASGPAASTAKTAAKAAARATINVRETRKGFARGRKRFGEAVWGPFAKLSRVLWLEITGSFFGIFAIFAGSAVWAHRFDLRATSANHDARLHLLVFAAMTLVFGYFCISSFVRAYRR